MQTKEALSLHPFDRVLRQIESLQSHVRRKGTRPYRPDVVLAQVKRDELREVPQVLTSDLRQAVALQVEVLQLSERGMMRETRDVIVVGVQTVQGPR